MNIQVFDKPEFKYRLGDIVLLGNNALGKVLHPDSPFHDTIGYDYAKISYRRNRFLDFELLKRLVKDHMQKHQYAVPPSDVLVIHYRAGDWKRVDGDEIDALSAHAKNACAASHLAKVEIVTAFHYGKNFQAEEMEEMSKENLRNLTQLVSKLEEEGMSVSVKSSGRIDEDFCYLTYANHLLPTKGGFSILAGICNPNSVYPTFRHTTAAIRHYSEMKPVSLSIIDVLVVFLKEMVGKNPMKKNINPLSLMLEKFKP